MKRKLLLFFNLLILSIIFSNQSYGQFIGANVWNANYPQLNDGYIELFTDGLVSPISYSWSNGETSKNIFDLSPGEYSILVTDSLNQVFTDTFTIETTNLDYQFTWAITPSLVVHQICFPINITVNGLPLQLGDKIGVFYDSLGYWACSNFHSWNGAPFCLNAYSDSTGNAGFEDNEQFKFLIRSQQWGYDFVATAIFDTISAGLNDSLFVIGGTSQILSLTADTIILQTILLGSENSWLYSPTQAVNTDCTEMFSHNYNSSSISVMKDTIGNIFWPQYGINFIGGVNAFDKLWADMFHSDYFQFEAYLPDSTMAVINPNICYNTTDGYINLYPAFGIPPYTYLWNNGSTTQHITDIPLYSTYSVTITDSQLSQEVKSLTASPLFVYGVIPEVNLIVGNTSAINGGSIEAEIINFNAWNAQSYNWSNGESGATIINQPAGTYYLTIENNLGCLFDTSAVIENTTFNVNISHTNVTTAGASDGSALTMPTLGTPPYSYLWSNGDTLSMITGLSEGFYSITVTDALNNIASAFVQITTQIEVIPTITHPSLSTNSDGSITTIVTGGQAPYTFTWSNGATSPAITNLPIGLYMLTVTDISGNILIDQFYLDALEISANETFPSDSITCDGSIDISISGGFPPFTYYWSNGETTEDIYTLCSGIYSVTVIDYVGFMTTLDLGLIVNSSIVFAPPIATGQLHAVVFPNDSTYYQFNGNSISLGDLIGAFYQSNNAWHCAGYIEWSAYPSSNIASIWGDDPLTTDVDGYIYGEEFKWFIYDVSANQSYYSPAIYDLNFPNEQYYLSNGQSAVYSLGFTSISLIFDIVSSDLSCYNSNDGSASISNLTGMPPFSYQWSNGATTELITGLATGNYSVTVTDNNNIQNSQSFQITQPDEIILIGNITNVSTPSASDGLINLMVSGGVYPYTYFWNTGETTQDLILVPSDNYTVVVTDANMCNAVNTYFVDTIPNFSLSAVGTVTDASCNSQCDGSIDITASGGSQPISYIWSNGESTIDVNNLCPGNYSVDIFEHGSIETGPPAPWDYHISGINHSVYIDAPGLLINAVNPPIGSYIGAFFDNNGVLECGGYTQWLGSSIAVSVWGDDPSTIGIKDGFTNGETFQWFIHTNNTSIALDPVYSSQPANNSTYVTNGQSAIFSLTGSYYPDITLNFTVGEPDLITVIPSITPATQNLANDGAISIVVSGGSSPYEYLWSNGETTQNISGLAVGVYILTITDANLCEFTKDFIVGLQGIIEISGITSNNSCFGVCDGTIIPEISGGTPPYNFTWSNGVTTLIQENLCSGEYQLYVQDNGSSIQGPSYPWSYINTSQNQTIIIQAGTVYLDGLVASSGSIIGVFYDDNGNLECGGYALWTGSTVVITAWADDTLTIDKDGFSEGEILTFLVNELGITYNMMPNFNFAAGSAVFSTNNNSILNSLENTTNVFTYYNFSISQPDTISLSSVINDAISGTGNNGSINIFPTGGTVPYQFNWSNNETTQNISNLISANYYLTLTDANGCVITENFFINEVPIALFTNSVNITDVLCYDDCDGEIDLTIIGGIPPFNYVWSNGSTTQDITNLCEGNYNVTVTSGTVSTISEPWPWTYTNTTLNSTIIINSGSVLIDGNPPPLGSYLGVFYNDNGAWECGGYSEYNGTVTAITAWGDDLVNPDKVGFSVGEAYTWLLYVNGNIYNLDPVYDILISTTNVYEENGLYGIISLTSLSGGSTSYNFTIQQPDSISFSWTTFDAYGLDPNGYIDIQVNGGVSPYTYLWSNGETTEDIYQLNQGTYDITVTDNNNCTMTESIIVGYSNPFSPLMATANATNNICNGDCLGSIALGTSGGLSPYIYQWSNGETTDTIYNLCAGNYSVTVGSYAGNVSPMPWDFVVTNYEGHYLGSVTVNGSYGDAGDYIGAFYNDNGSYFCAGYSELGISGDYNLFVQGDDPATSQKDGFENLEQITFKLWRFSDGEIIDLPNLTLITSLGGCGLQFCTTGADRVAAEGNYIPPSYSPLQTILNITVSEALPFVVTDTIIHVDPNIGNYNGAIDITIAGGNPPYSFNWFGISNQYFTEDISGVPMGLYQLEIGDQSGCTYGDDYWIEYSTIPSLVASTGQISEPACPQSCDASIDLIPSGGIQPYTFQWSTGETTEDINNLCEGTYEVTITDSQFSISPNFPYSFVPSNSAISHSIVLDTAFLVNNTPAIVGDYVAIFYDDNGILECGGYIIWDDSTQLLNVWLDDLATTDKDGFTIGEEFVWKYWSHSTGTLYNCDALYSSSSTNSGNFVSNGNSEITELYGSIHSTSIQSFVLNDPIALNSSGVISYINPLIGNNGVIDINILGGTSPYTTLWSNGSTSEDISGLTYGEYTLTITDANLCQHSDTFFMEFSGQYLSFDVSSTDIDCNGAGNGEAWVDNLIGIAPINYIWSNGETTSSISNLSPGQYFVTVSAGNGDIDIDSVMISEPDDIFINFIVAQADPALQINGSIEIIVSGGVFPYSFLWSDGSTVADILSASYGEYSVTVTDANMCTETSTTFVDFNLLPDWNFNLYGNTHSIDIPPSTLMQINGMSLDINDFIGVFYDSSGVMSCGGYLIWQQATSTLLAYGDDAISSEPDGFADGEEFEWIIWDASTNMEHLAAPSYDTTYQDTRYWVNNGESGLDSLQVVTISGTVTTPTKSNLPLGMIILYTESEGIYTAVEKGFVIDGEFEISGILPGEYLVYALPAPGYDYGIPGYFIQRNGWIDASFVHAVAYTGSVDIIIEPVIQYTTGIGVISGSVYVGSDSSYNPNVYGDEWFQSSTKDDEVPARNISILLFDENMNAMDFRLTNDLGEFDFQSLDYGTYYIRVEKAGLLADEIMIILSEDNPTTNLIFTLESGQVVSIEDIIENDNFLIYPNPVNTELYITIDKYQDTPIFKMYSITGQKINISDKTILSDNIFSVDMRSLKPGIYILEIINDSNRHIHKINKF